MSIKDFYDNNGNLHISGGLISVGDKSICTNNASLALGFDSGATAAYAISLGESTASAIHSLAVGANSTSSAQFALAIGEQTEATGASAVAIGKEAKSSDGASIALGRQTQAGGDNSIALGNLANTNNQINTVVINTSGVAQSPQPAGSGFYMLPLNGIPTGGVAVINLPTGGDWKQMIYNTVTNEVGWVQP
jgi:hypothetical protein